MLQLCEKINLAESDVVKKTNNRDKLASDNWNWWLNVRRQREKNSYCYKKKSDEVCAAQKTLSDLKVKKNELEKSFSEWEEESRKRVGQLKQQAESIRVNIDFNTPLVTESENNAINNSQIQQLGHEENRLPSKISYSCDDTQTEISDSPNMVYKKANDAMMSEEGIAQMDKEADAQAKEILNNHN